MISIDTINSLLSLEGIDEGLSEEEFDILLESKLLELESLVGVDITPKNRKQYEFNFSSKVLELNFYPIRELIQLKVNDVEFTDFVLNDDLGIVHFNNTIHGNVVVEYMSGLSDNEIKTSFVPLLKDMIIFTVANRNIVGEGVLSSIKEGDISIGYDVSNSRGNRIWSRVEELKSRYSAKIKMV